MAGKPVYLFAAVPSGSNLHFLSVPSTKALEKTYLPGSQLSHGNYPTLIQEGQAIETIGVVLAVFGWPANSIRYEKLTTLVDTFFTKFPEILKPPHHPKWHDVNIAAT